MKNKNTINKLLNFNLIIGIISLIILLLNVIFVKNNYITGFVLGINFMAIFYDLIILENRKNELNEYGFRKDFDWETRFDLKTEVNGYIVSTVDLGIDHSFGVGEPLYYETMIFDKDGKTLDGFQARYSTKQQAKKGHKKAIEYVKSLENENDRTKTN